MAFSSSDNWGCLRCGLEFELREVPLHLRVESCLVSHNRPRPDNPARTDSHFPCSMVVVKLTLGSLNHLVFRNPELLMNCMQHIFEVAGVWLIASNLLGSNHQVERKAFQRPLVRPLKGLDIDIRETNKV